MHQCDRRLGEFVEQLHRSGRRDRGGVILGRRIVGDLTEPADVGASLEVLACATDYETAHGGVDAEPGQTMDQPVQHGGVIGIPDLGRLRVTVATPRSSVASNTGGSGIAIPVRIGAGRDCSTGGKWQENV